MGGKQHCGMPSHSCTPRPWTVPDILAVLCKQGVTAV